MDNQTTRKEEERRVTLYMKACKKLGISLGAKLEDFLKVYKSQNEMLFREAVEKFGANRNAIDIFVEEVRKENLIGDVLRRFS